MKTYRIEISDGGVCHTVIEQQLPDVKAAESYAAARATSESEVLIMEVVSTTNLRR